MIKGRLVTNRRMHTKNPLNRKHFRCSAAVPASVLAQVQECVGTMRCKEKGASVRVGCVLSRVGHFFCIQREIAPPGQLSAEELKAKGFWISTANDFDQGRAVGRSQSTASGILGSNRRTHTRSKRFWISTASSLQRVQPSVGARLQRLRVLSFGAGEQVSLAKSASAPNTHKFLTQPHYPCRSSDASTIIAS
jgi:hypothetical protein